MQAWMRVRKGGPSKDYGSVELLARMSVLVSSGKSCPSVKITPTYVASISEWQLHFFLKESRHWLLPLFPPMICSIRVGLHIRYRACFLL